MLEPWKGLSLLRAPEEKGKEFGLWFLPSYSLIINIFAKMNKKDKKFNINQYFRDEIFVYLYLFFLITKLPLTSLTIII